jgi:OMF family outer membrane factor
MKKYKNRSILFVLMLSGIGSLNAQEAWTLAQCIDSAIVNNKKLKVSQNQILLANEKQKEVKANLLPKITANGDYKYYTDLPTQLMPSAIFGGPEGFYKEAQFGVQHNITGNIQLVMPIYSPELMGGITQVKVAKEIAQINYQKTEEEIHVEVTGLFYNSEIIKNQLTFVDSNLINANKLLKNISLLNEQLLVQKLEVDKVALQIKQLASKKKILLSKNEQILNGLKFLIGLPQEAMFSIAPIEIASSEKEYTLQKSLDLKLLETKYSLLNTELNTLSKSRYLPSAFLYASLGKIGYGYEKPMPVGGDFYGFYNMGFVGAKLSIPIFNGTVTNKKITQKRIEIENNELQKSLVTDQNKMLYNNAILTQSAAQETIHESELQIELAQNIYNKVVLQNKNGVATITDVLLAENEINKAQQSFLAAKIDYLKSNLELKRISGSILLKK